MTHPTDHRPEWNTPVDDYSGEPTGPTTCEVCGIEPSTIKCVNCGKLESETTISHGRLGAMHSTRRLMDNQKFAL